MSDTVLLHKENGVGYITFNRPDKYNSFNREMALALQGHLDNCAADETVRCIYISGSGKGFCAGQDLAETPDPKNVDFDKIVSQHYNPVKLGKSLFGYLLYQFNRLKTAPVEAIMDEYNSYLHRKGEQVKLKKGNIVFSARIDGVSAKGELISTAATQELYNVGEVEFV